MPDITRSQNRKDSGGNRFIYSIFDVPEKTRRAWARDSTAGFMAGIYMGGMLPFVLVIARKQLHTSGVLIGLMVSAPYMGNLMALLWARAMEGKPKMPFVTWPSVAGRAILILMLFTVTPVWYAVVVTVSQFLVTLSAPAYASVMKDIYPDAHRGRLMGYVRVLIALANILTTLAVGRFLGGWNYRWVFPIAGLFGVLASLTFATIRTSPTPPEEIENKRNTHEFLFDAVRLLHEDKRFLWFSIAMFIFGFGNLLLLPVYPIFQVDRLHYGPRDIALLTMVFNVVWMFSYLYWGKYVDVSHPVKAVLINVLVTLLIPLNYILAGTMNSPHVAVLFPSAVFMGISAAGTELAYFNAVIQYADVRRIPTYMAIFTCLLGFRGSVAPFLGAAAMRSFNSHGWDLSHLFGAAMVMMFAGMILQVIGMRRENIY